VAAQFIAPVGARFIAPDPGAINCAATVRIIYDAMTVTMLWRGIMTISIQVNSS